MLEKIRKIFSGKDLEERDELPVHAQCPHHFGYLANRGENDPIPQECMICLSILKCIELNLT